MVNSWEDTLLGDTTAQVGGRVQVGEGVGWCWVGIVISGDIDGLDRGNRTVLGRR